MNEHIQRFLKALNEEYTKRGVNAVAVAQQIGHSGWYIYVYTDYALETYLVVYENGEWTFLREYQT